MQKDKVSTSSPLMQRSDSGSSNVSISNTTHNTQITNIHNAIITPRNDFIFSFNDANMNDNVQQLQKENQALREQLAAQNLETPKFKQLLVEVIKWKDSTTKDTNEIVNKIKKLEEEYESVSKINDIMIADMNSTPTGLEDEVTKWKEKYDKELEQKEDLEKTNFQVKEEKKYLIKEQERLKEENENLQEKNENLQKEKTDLQQQIGQQQPPQDKGIDHPYVKQIFGAILTFVIGFVTDRYIYSPKAKKLVKNRSKNNCHHEDDYDE